MDHLGDALKPTLVTGASGYLGGRVLAMLQRNGVSALGVGRSVQCDVVCDLLNRNATEALVAQYPDSQIIHCAAAVPKSHAEYSDKKSAAESLEMVRNLVSVGPRHMIFTSSMTVYPEDTVLAREEYTASIGNGYAASKLEAERVLLECPDITATILRLPGLFGLPRRGGVLFNSALALARGETPILERSLPQWAAIHVEDAADICVRAAFASPKCSMVMNVGYPGRMAISDAVTQLATLFGRELVVPPPKWFAFDLSRLNETLGPVSGELNDRLRDLASWARINVRNG